jgi:hypothetical protein
MGRMGVRASRVRFFFFFFFHLRGAILWTRNAFHIDEYSIHATNLTLVILYHTSGMRSRIILRRFNLL